MRVLVALLLATPAFAAERMLVRAVEFAGPAASEVDTAHLRESLVGGLAAGGFELVPEATMQRELEKSPQLYACTTETCLAALANAVGARWAITVEVDVIARGTMGMRVRVIDGKTGQTPVKEDPTCNACTVEEVENWVSAAGPLVRRKLEPLIALGTQAPPSQSQSAPVEKPSSARWALRGLGIGAAALGVAGLIAGFVELSRDGQKACTAPPGAVCDQHLDTTGAQIFSFVGGAAMLGAAAALSYFGWRKPKHPVALAPFGAGVKLTLGF
jgi:hypothetical protein